MVSQHTLQVSRPTPKSEVEGIWSRPSAKGEVEGDLPGGACSRGGVWRPQQQTATVADGTHPTGMHSYDVLFSQ